jgi:hypothetical protein
MINKEKFFSAVLSAVGRISWCSVLLGVLIGFVFGRAGNDGPRAPEGGSVEAADTAPAAPAQKPESKPANKAEPAKPDKPDKTPWPVMPTEPHAESKKPEPPKKKPAVVRTPAPAHSEEISAAKFQEKVDFIYSMRMFGVAEKDFRRAMQYWSIEDLNGVILLALDHGYSARLTIEDMLYLMDTANLSNATEKQINYMARTVLNVKRGSIHELNRR